MTNRVNDARDNTLITRATGDALSRLGTNYGFVRPLYVPEADFAAALRVAVYASQPTFAVMFNFLTKLFNVWATYSTIDGVAESADSLALSLESVELTAPANLEQRFGLVGDKVVFLSSITEGVAQFAPVNTAYFQKPEFVEGDSYTIKLLPFTLTDMDCIFTLILDSGIFTVPSTFLQQQAEAQEEGEPPYGFLMDFFSTEQGERFGSADGPYPAYLVSDFFESKFFALLDKMLAAGVQLRATNILWAKGELSMYNSFKDLLAGGGAGNNPFSVEVARV